MLQAAAAPASARQLAMLWFAQLCVRHQYDLERVVRAWTEAWARARPRVEIREPTLHLFGQETDLFSVPFARMPPPLLRAVQRAVSGGRFGSASLSARGLALLRRYEDDAVDDPRAIERRLWRALLRALPPAVAARARRARRRRA